jgi:hypothetical protein
LRLTSLAGEIRCIAEDAGAPHEITEAQARRWAKDELGKTLEELKLGLDEKLAELRQKLEEFNKRPVDPKSKLTPDVGPALLALLKELPGILGKSLSGDAERVGAARGTMEELRRRLEEAGIDLGERFTGFPDRLAELRREVERERAAARGEPPKPPPEER